MQKFDRGGISPPRDCVCVCVFFLFFRVGCLMGVGRHKGVTQREHLSPDQTADEGYTCSARDKAICESSCWNDIAHESWPTALTAERIF